MKRVLVTGASGFVGRHVTRLLSGDAFEVHAVSASGIGASQDSIWHRADLLDARQREALVEAVKPDALLHLAWHAKPASYPSAPANTAWLAASLDLFRLFAEHGGKRVVGAGSCAEYDWRHGYCTEFSTPLLPSSLYGVTKAACGSVLDAYSRETGLSAAWGRFFFLFGPYDSPLRLIPSLVRKLAAGQPARCTAGSHIRDFLHVEDAAAALVELLRSTVTGAVNIGSGAPLCVGDIARQIGTTLGRPDLLTIDEGPAEHMLVCANIARLRDEVGWRPASDTRSRLDDTIRWWQSPEAAQVTP
jgi:nucleoside-diphosphate-sugar epimerase